MSKKFKLFVIPSNIKPFEFAGVSYLFGPYQPPPHLSYSGITTVPGEAQDFAIVTHSNSSNLVNLAKPAYFGGPLHDLLHDQGSFSWFHHKTLFGYQEGAPFHEYDFKLVPVDSGGGDKKSLIQGGDFRLSFTLDYGQGPREARFCTLMKKGLKWVPKNKLRIVGLDWDDEQGCGVGLTEVSIYAEMERAK